MRGLVTAALVLAPALASSFTIPHDEHHGGKTEVAEDQSSALISLGGKDLKSHDAMNFRLDILPSTEPCGFGNVTIDGQVLPQTEKEGVWSGNGSVPVGGKSIAVASWSFECLNIPNVASVQLMKFKVDAIDGKSLEDVGFTAVFKQAEDSKIIEIVNKPTLPEFPSPAEPHHGQHPHPAEHHPHGGDGPQGHHEVEFHQRFEEDMAELRFMKHQLLELEWMIYEKEQAMFHHHKSHKSHKDSPELGQDIQQCDSLRCLIKAAVDKARGAVNNVVGKFGREDEMDFHGRHEFPHPPRERKHGNHTGGPHGPHKGNHTHPHFPKRPHGLPVCRFPPPPPHGHGPPGPPPPFGHHMRPDFHSSPPGMHRGPHSLEPQHGKHSPPELDPEERRPVEMDGSVRHEDEPQSEHDGAFHHGKPHGKQHGEGIDDLEESQPEQEEHGRPEFHDSEQHEAHPFDGPKSHEGPESDGPPQHERPEGHPPHGGPDFNGPPPHGRPEFDGPHPHQRPEGHPPHGGPDFDGPPPHGRPEFDGPHPHKRPEGRPPHGGPDFDSPSAHGRPEFDGPPPHERPEGHPPHGGPEFDGPPPHGRPEFDGIPPHDGPENEEPHPPPGDDGPGGPPPFDGPHRGPPKPMAKVFHVFKWSVVAFLCTIFLAALHKRTCTPDKRAKRQARREKRELRRAHRREVHKNAIMKLMARIGGNDSESDDFEEKYKHQRLMSDAEDGMSTTMSDEITQLRTAASVVGEIVAASPDSPRPTPSITVSVHDFACSTPSEQAPLFSDDLYSEELPAYEDNDGSEASSIIADGFRYTPGSSEYSPSHSSSGSVSDILGPDTKQ
ncbi:hypothetical protein BP5796_01469 [Coleophoma crateriformis]|uniref:Uncharacterized protein n=1 Tax=Coleophoma crateriformis TaxID=565419 RepID=A0A3D8T0H7_9HELO|nr:hypothetical protein BP5796_01469 [Coleophoma crateriformis]